MILFLYGEDTFRSQRQLKEIRTKFLKDIDPSGMNLTELDGDKAGVDEADAALRSASFLADRRLVVLKGFLRANKGKKTKDKALAELCDSVPDDAIAVFFEQAGADALGKSETFKRLRKEKFYPEFQTLAPRQLQGWVRKEAKERGFEFTRDGLKAYTVVAGDDLWKIDAELEKFAAYARTNDGKIDAEAVGALSHAETEESIFEFLDMIGARRADRAAEILDGLLRQGESEIMLMSRLQNHFRSLLVCADIARTERVKKDRLVRELGIHPFVATKVLSQSRYFTREELVGLYAWLIEADKKLKTGGWPKQRMALDMLLLQLAERKAA